MEQPANPKISHLVTRQFGCGWLLIWSILQKSWFCSLGKPFSLEPTGVWYSPLHWRILSLHCNMTCYIHRPRAETVREVAGLHSPSSWLQGSWLIAKDAAWTLPQAGPVLDAVSGYSDTSDRIHNSLPLTPKQLSVQEVPQKEVFKPAGFQRSAEIWYTKQMSLQRVFGFAFKIQIS